MNVDAHKSQYHEAASAKNEFDKAELRRLRLLLRRLRFLENQVRQNGIAESTSGGAAFAEWEVEALEWVLDDMGFLEDRTEQ